LPRQDSGVEARSRGGLRTRSALVLWAIFAAALLGILLLGRIYANQQRSDIVERKGRELSAVRDLKIDQIVEWRAGLMNDGRTLAEDPALGDEFARWLAAPSNADAVSDLQAWMAVLKSVRGYSGAIIITTDGSNWLATERDARPTAFELAMVRRAAASGETTLTDIFLGGDGRPRLDVVAPLRSPDGSVPAVALLHHDPSRYLFPLLQRWPSPSASSETLLVRAEGGSILFLNNLRFGDRTALRLRIDRSAYPRLLAVQAMEGPARTTEGIDYRGTQVFGAVGRVDDTDWYLVAKVDESEALAGVAEVQAGIVLVAVGLLCLVGLALALVWRQRTSEYYREQLESERAKALLAEQYSYLTRFANDAIILADEDLRVLQANERAVSLYGYPSDTLLAMTLDDLIAPDDEGERRSAAELLLAGTTDLIALHQRRADGTTFDAEMSARTIVTDEETVYLTITRDVTERNLAEQALRESELQFRNIVNSSPSAMYLYRLEDGDRLVLTKANPAADRLIGIDHDALIGKTIEEAFPNLVETDVPDMYRAVARGERDAQSFEIPYEDDRLGGYYAVTVFRTLPGVVAVDFVDISDRRRAQQELEERTEELVRSNAELEKFAYVASHDLQEPLRMVASYTQLLQRRYRGRLDDDADEFIAYAVDGATRMQQLINELLAYSRVGSQGAEFVETDLNEVLDRVLQVLALAIEENGAEVTGDRLPTVTCDPTQIGQVLQNLVSNALKFRCDDPPRIHVGAKRDAEGWVIYVQDNGVGIEPEYFDRIFVIFQRLRSREEYPGTGMGLAICKRIIERHGGRIWVESKQGTGSTFYFTLREHKESR